MKLDSLAGYDQDTEVDIDTQNDKTVVGFWLTISPGESKQIEFKYNLPFRLSFKDGKTDYKLIVQRQAGIKKTEFISQIEVAKGLSLSLENPKFQQILFADQLTKDEVITVSIYKK